MIGVPLATTGGRPQAKEKAMAVRDDLLLGVEEDGVVTRREANGGYDGGGGASDFV